MAKKKKLKKGPKILLVFLIFLIVIGIYANKKYQEYLYHQTNEYKLLEKTYTKDEVNTILKLNSKEVETILNLDYNVNIPLFLNEKYFIFNNLERYLKYQQDNLNTPLSEIVSLINVNRDSEYYENTVSTNLEEENLILVNKYHYLSEDYVPENLENISYQYAYADNKATTLTIEAFKNMYNDAKKEDIILIINSSYRSYEDQEEIWSTRKKLYGIKKADSYAARAGYSEHQTGLAIDINQYNYNGENFEDAPAFAWLATNAYKYGFILRYPEGKENITGYAYESWHYRYVGIETAKQIHDENITYDEFYAYYIANK